MGPKHGNPWTFGDFYIKESKKKQPIFHSICANLIIYEPSFKKPFIF
jgi:hypothetical protein